MEIKRIIKDNRGSGFPLTVAIVLSLFIIFTGISEYFRLGIIAQGVQDALQDAVISTVNDNYDDVYHGVREGYSGAYQPITQTFEESVDYGDIYSRLDEVLELNQKNGYHIKTRTDNTLEFKLWELDVNIKNAPIANGDLKGQRFEIDSSIMIEVPISFGGKILPSMKMKIKNSAGYTPKF